MQNKGFGCTCGRSISTQRDRSKSASGLRRRAAAAEQQVAEASAERAAEGAEGGGADGEVTSEKLHFRYTTICYWEHPSLSWYHSPSFFLRLGSYSHGLLLVQSSAVSTQHHAAIKNES
jgi:hypothetical protein